MLVMGLALAACDGPSSSDAEFAQVIGTETERLFQDSPIMATYYAVGEKLGGTDYLSRLPDFSPAAEERQRIALAQFARALADVDPQRLGDRAKADHAIITAILDAALAARHLPYGTITPLSFVPHAPYIVSPISGPHIDIPHVMQAQQSVANLDQARAYIARLEGFDRMMASVAAKITADARDGLILPLPLLHKTRAVLDSFDDPAPRAHILYTSFADRLAGLPALDAATKQALLDDAALAIETVVYPAYRRVDAALHDVSARAHDLAGIWAQPGGAEFYQAAILAQGAGVLTAQAVHQTGLAEVARIESEMDTILTAQGYSEGSVGARMAALGAEPRFLFANNDDGRDQLLAYLRQAVTAIEQRLPDYFQDLPHRPVDIRRVPAFNEGSSPSGYYDPPSLDGARPGIYWINLRDMTAWPRYTLKTLSYHETVPGHHLQVAEAMNLPDLPLLRRLAPFNSYVEGWALYAEHLAWEMGLYDDDPFGNLGRLQDELFRAVRLVVDTGIHAKRWTREQAIAYMHQTTGNHIDEVTREIERYMAWPGQALGYKLGMIKLMALREEAQAALGDAFDLRAFHHQVLRAGPMPLPVLAEQLDAWLAAQPTQP